MRVRVWLLAALLIGGSLCTCSRPMTVEVRGVMVLRVDVSDFEPEPATPVPGTIDVLGPFTSAQADRQVNLTGDVDQELVVTTVPVNDEGVFSFEVAPGRYVLVGHPPDEGTYLSSDGPFQQRRVLVVPRSGVRGLRFLLYAIFP